MPKRKIATELPYAPWKCDKRTTLAFKALEAGNANEEQQKHALNYLIKIGCRTYDMDWFPDERVSSFAAGRRFVGQEIVKQLQTRLGE